MKALIKLFLYLDGKRLALLWLGCMLTGVVDYYYVYPSWYFLFLLLFLVSLSISMAFISWVNEFNRGVFPYLENLPVSRRQLWFVKYCIGLLVVLLCLLPIMLGRLPFFCGAREIGFFTLKYLYDGLNGFQFLLAGAVVAFNFFSISYFICLACRFINISLAMAVNIILLLLFFLGASSIPVLTNLLPNLYELAPLFLFSGVLFLAASYVVFVPQKQRNWSTLKALTVSLSLIIINSAAFAVMTVSFNQKWQQANLQQADNVNFYTSNAAPNQVLVSFHNRRSGLHKVIVNADKKEQAFHFKKYSSLLFNAKKDYIFECNRSPCFSYFFGRKQFFSTILELPGLYKHDLNTGTESAVPLFFQKQPIDSQGYEGLLVRHLDNNFSWHVNNTILIAQFDLFTARKFPFLKRFAQPNKQTIILQDLKGNIIKQLYFDSQYIKGIYKTENRLLIVSYLKAKEKRLKLLRYYSLNLKTLQEHISELPGYNYISNDLSRMMFLKRNVVEQTYHYSLIEYDILSCKNKVVISERQLLRHDIRDHVSNLRLNVNSALTRGIVASKQLKGTKVVNSLTCYDFQTGESTVILGSDQVPSYDFIKPKERYYFEATGFAAKGNMFYYALVKQEISTRMQTYERYRYDCKKNKNKRLLLSASELKNVVDISPDNQQILFISKQYVFRTAQPAVHQDHIVCYDINSGKRKPLFPSSDEQIISPESNFSINNYRWLGNGKIIFGTDRRIWTINSDGSNLTRIFP